MLIERDDTGHQRLEDLDALVHWLYPGSAVTRFRFGPSLVCRSEIAVLGLSSPRFAIRAYVDDENGNVLGFFNLRRLRQLAERVASIGEFANGKPTQLLRSSRSFIADSILAVPKRILADFDCLKAEIGDEYAESNLAGSAFMQSMRLGGGLCAQSCAWMAGIHCLDHASTVHGPSEISCIAGLGTSDLDVTTKVGIDGLSHTELIRYFEEIKLQAPIHLINATRPHERSSIPPLIKSYICSGFPVIASVDLGRLLGYAGRESGIGESIYAANALPGTLRPKVVLQTLHHAVLIHGFSKTTNSLVLSDPASVPYLVVDCDELVNRRTYGLDLREPHRLIDENLATHFRFQPILPAEIKCFLGNWNKGAGSDEMVGLDMVYGRASRNTELWIKRGLPVDLASKLPSRMQSTEVRLCNFSVLSSAAITMKTIYGFHEGVFHALAKELKGWSWVQRVPLEDKTIWFCWNAQIPTKSFANHGVGKSDEIVARLLQRVILQDASGKVIDISAKEADGDTDDSEIKPVQGNYEQQKLNACQVSVITSCFPKDTIGGLSMVRQRLVDDKKLSKDAKLPVELYIAMESDCEALVEDNETGIVPDVVQLLASSFDSPVLDSWAKALAGRLSDSYLLAKGLASFIPEIASGNNDRRLKGVRAHCALQRIAQILCTESEHDVGFVEFVGGTLFGELTTHEIPLRAIGSQFNEWEVELQNRKRLIERIAQSLESVAEWTRLELGIEPLPFLAELEPGPAFVLNSIESLLSLHAECSGRGIPLYFNLDVPHLRLCNQSTEFSRHKELRRNVRNTHLSGHGKAHLGDCILANQIERSDFSLLKECQSLGHSDVGISLEFEAAPSIQAVVDSYSSILSLQ